MLYVRYFVGNGCFIFVTAKIVFFYKKNKLKYIFNNRIV
ncbi:unknown [Phocaeicola coprophilus CAG:333]|nr:unknown [Phocaeicola coprophilus CAG:333]